MATYYKSVKTTGVCFNLNVVNVLFVLQWLLNQLVELPTYLGDPT